MHCGVKVRLTACLRAWEDGWAEIQALENCEQKRVENCAAKACRDNIIFNAASERTRKVASTELSPSRWYSKLGYNIRTSHPRPKNDDVDDASQLHNESWESLSKIKIINLFVNETTTTMKGGRRGLETSLCKHSQIADGADVHRLVSISSESLHHLDSSLFSCGYGTTKIDEQLSNFFTIRDMKNLCCEQFT